MLEDWCACHGYREKPHDAEAVRDRSHRGQPRIWEADLGFRNVDGAFWLMHSDDTRLAETVIKYLAKVIRAA